ncbi:Probable serine/threonine-protein kinase PBL5 [Linum grandiflorum]
MDDDDGQWMIELNKRWPRQINLENENENYRWYNEGFGIVHREKGKIHRDVKSSNILLTKDWQAKLADFGTIIDCPEEGETHVTTISAPGTMGYIELDYARDHQLRWRSDLWSFACVLLELIFGKKGHAPDMNEDNHYLGVWAKGLFETREDSTTEHRMVDPSLSASIKRLNCGKLLVCAKRAY